MPEGSAQGSTVAANFKAAPAATGPAVRASATGTGCPPRRARLPRGAAARLCSRDTARLALLVWSALLILPARALPAEGVLGTDYAVVQTAGFVGFVAAGVGWELGPNHEINTLLGYVPESITGFELWQLTGKYEYHPFAREGFGAGGRTKASPLYLGFSLIYGHSPRLHFGDLPEEYPNPNYYPETAFRCTLNVGTAFPLGGMTAYAEYDALCIGVIAYYRAPRWFQEHYRAYGLEGIGSLAFGLKGYY